MGRVGRVVAHRRRVVEGVGVHGVPVVVEVAPHGLLRGAGGNTRLGHIRDAMGGAAGDEGRALVLPLVLGQPVPPHHLPGGAREVVDLSSTYLEIEYLKIKFHISQFNSHQVDQDIQE